MSSSPTGSNSPDDAALQAWAEEVGHHIPDGEAWTIAKRDGGVHLERGPVKDHWKDVHPELHGYLEGLEERIDDAAGCLPLVIALALGGLLAALAVWIFPESKKIAGGIAFAVCFGLWIKYDDIQEARVYRAERSELMRRLNEARIHPDTMIGWMAGDGELSSVRTQMQTNREALVSRPTSEERSKPVS